MGKSTTVHRILCRYPQVIEHSRYNQRDIYHRQLVWLRLDVPYDASVRGLCQAFLLQASGLLGIEYARMYNAMRGATDYLLAAIGIIASLHGLGLLVVDELQNINSAYSRGDRALVNALTALTNQIGVPLLLIGTPAARGLLQHEFRLARRGVTTGYHWWDPQPEDAEWRSFCQALWRHQTLPVPTPYADELAHALWHESIGIPDVALTTFYLAQERSLATNLQPLTPMLLATIAREELGDVSAAIAAIREGGSSSMEHPDIAPLRPRPRTPSALPTALPCEPCAEVAERPRSIRFRRRGRDS
jgi:hypothetical protein